MGLGHGPYIPRAQSCYFYFDVKNPRCVVDQNTIKPLIDNDSVGNFVRAYTSGTTTIESTTVNYTDLAYIDTSEGVIRYDTVNPVGDISPYYSAGGNRYYSAKNKAWGTADFTWGIWHYPTTFSQRGYAPCLIDWKYSNARNSEFGLNGTGIPFVNYRIVDSPYTSTTVTSDLSAANLNKWNFTLVKRESGVAKFFQNGTFSSTFAYNVDYKDAAGIGIGWGADKDASWGNFKSKIGPAITYTVALTDAEIIKLYQSLKSRFQ